MAKILIVEDEKILREMYKEKFQKEGFEVAVAPDAEDALIATKVERPDLVILDILLPKGNGISFLEKLKGLNPDPKMKIIAFSNYDDQKTKESAKEFGAVEYLIKANYTPAQIVEKIKKYLKL